MKEVKAAMEKYPDLFEVTDWKALNHAKGWEIIAGPYFMDGGQQDTAAMKEYGEPKELLTRFIIKENKRCKDYTISEAWDVFPKLTRLILETHCPRSVQSWLL